MHAVKLQSCLVALHGHQTAASSTMSLVSTQPTQPTTRLPGCMVQHLMFSCSSACTCINNCYRHSLCKAGVLPMLWFDMPSLSLTMCLSCTASLRDILRETSSLAGLWPDHGVSVDQVAWIAMESTSLFLTPVCKTVYETLCLRTVKRLLSLRILTRL